MANYNKESSRLSYAISGVTLGIATYLFFAGIVIPIVRASRYPTWIIMLSVLIFLYALISIIAFVVKINKGN